MLLKDVSVLLVGIVWMDVYGNGFRLELIDGNESFPRQVPRYERFSEGSVFVSGWYVCTKLRV